MWFISVEVEQEMSAPPPKKNPGSAAENDYFNDMTVLMILYTLDIVSVRLDFCCLPGPVFDHFPEQRLVIEPMSVYVSANAK